jgi:hypothetical protein
LTPRTCKRRRPCSPSWPEALFSAAPLFGVGLPTPPKAPTVGLLCGLWHGQETGHSVEIEQS